MTDTQNDPNNSYSFDTTLRTLKQTQSTVKDQNKQNKSMKSKNGNKEKLIKKL